MVSAWYFSCVKTLVGTVRGDGIVIGYSRVSAPGYEREAVYAHQFFELELDDSTVVSVEVNPRDLWVSKRLARERKRPWSKLADEPACAPFQDDAPAPHVEVTLHDSAIRAGDHIEVVGEWGRSFGEGASHREAPESSKSFQLKRVNPAPRKPKPPKAARGWSILGLLSGLVAIAAFVMTAMYQTTTSAMGGIAFLAAALWYTYDRAKPGVFFGIRGPRDGSNPNTVFVEWAVLFVGAIIFYGIASAEISSGPDVDNLMIAVGFGTTLCLFLAIRVFVHRRNTARLLRVAFSTGQSATGFRALTGELETELSCTETLVTVDGPGDDDIEYESRFVTNMNSRRPILVRTEEGFVELPTAQTAWFTSDRTRGSLPDNVDTEDVVRWTASIGDPVLVCAQFEGNKAKFRGDDSVLLVAEPNRAKLMLSLRGTMIVTFTLLGAAVVTLYVMAG